MVHSGGDLGMLAWANRVDAAAAALPTAYVDLSTTQTVGGVKNFTSNPTVNGVPIGGGSATLVENPPGSGFYDLGAPTPPAAPVFTASTPPPTATVGVWWGYQFTATGTPTFTVASGGIPSGTVLTSAGFLSGTPTLAGSASFTVSADNGTAPAALAACAVVVNAGATPPAFTIAMPPDGTVGAAYSYAFAASGSAPITFTLSSGAFPAGLVLSSDGVLAGTPSTAAAATFTVTATNAVGAVASQPKTVTMVAAGGGGTPAWRGDYQTSLLTGWLADQQMVRPAQQAIVTTPARAGYPNTARFIVAPGDYTNGGTSAERSEVYNSLPDNGSIASGMTMWWSWSIYVPAGTQVDSDATSPVGNGWMVITQMHGDDGGQPLIDFGLSKGTATPSLIISTLNSEFLQAAAFPLGQWVDMKLGVTFGSASTGRITVKQGAATVVNNAVAQTIQPGGTAYFKQGIYRAASNRTHTIYYTGTRRGPTEASVTL